MNVAIVGYGRMGGAVEKALASSSDRIVAVIDPVSTAPIVTAKRLSAEAVIDADVVIDFSSPASVIDNMVMYSRLSLPAVVGTTGWYSDLDRVKELCSWDGTRILYSGNFSLGVAAFLKIVKKAGEVFNKLEEYDVAIREVHHTGKADSPSGTALMIADQLLSTMDRKNELLIGNSQGRIPENVLQISSERVGKEPGLHEVVFDSEPDTITIEHHARGRDGFAHGAVAVARWLVNTEKRGLLTLDDYLESVLGE